MSQRSKSSKDTVSASETSEDFGREMIQNTQSVQTGVATEEALEILFANGKAEECFFRLAELYYERNFGTLSKSEVDYHMFRFFNEAVTDLSNKRNNRPSHYEAAQDLSTLNISLRLGVSPSRVEAFLEKIDVRDAEAAKMDSWSVIKGLFINRSFYFDSLTKQVQCILPSRFYRYRLEDALNKKQLVYDLAFNKRVCVIPSPVFYTLVKEALEGSEKLSVWFDGDFVERFLECIEVPDNDEEGAKKLSAIRKDLQELVKKGKGDVEEQTLVEKNIHDLATVPLSANIVSNVTSFVIQKLSGL